MNKKDTPYRPYNEIDWAETEERNGEQVIKEQYTGATLYEEVLMRFTAANMQRIDSRSYIPVRAFNNAVEMTERYFKHLEERKNAQQNKMPWDDEE